MIRKPTFGERTLGCIPQGKIKVKNVNLKIDIERTFEDGGTPLHVVLVPADPPELGGALAGGGLAQGTGPHCHSQAWALSPAVTPGADMAGP